MLSLQGFLVATTILSGVCAQTFSSCNPINATCSPNAGLNQWSYTTDFTSAEAASTYQQTWNRAAGTKVSFGSQGMIFNISNSAQAPTLFSNFTFLFGRVDVVMQAAPGTGIVSSIVLESADLDEVDIVVLGGNTTSLETNYYGKGSSNVLSYVAADSPQTKFHTYSLDWTSSSLVWSIDGTIVRTLAYSDADGGDSFPQTPMFLKLGSWDGGKPGGQPGTIAWAGGLTDFTDAPFLMYIQSVTITNYNPANFYNWTDKTGSFTSIDAFNSSSDTSSDPGTTTASAIVGGPTLVTGTASASASGAARTSTSGTSSTSDSSEKKNLAGRTVTAASALVCLTAILGFLVIGFAI